MKKRTFIKTATMASAGLPLFSIGTPKYNQAEDIRIAMIGMGKMNLSHLRSMVERARVVAVCDVDTTRREEAQKRVNERYGNKECAAYVDYRDILARKDVDAVCIATPDHWHATITIDAARAGKHVFCEKPLTHDLEESARIMKEVRDAGIIMQTGSQQRSMFKEFRVAAELIRNEVAGKVLSINTHIGGPAKPYDLEAEEMEPGLDWNRWCGPALLGPYHSDLSPRGVHEGYPAWRLYREYGGGGICDFGAHHLDIIQWALDKDHSGPVKALPPANGSNDWGAKLIYADGLAVTRSQGFNVDFHCENGRISASRRKFRFELDGKVIQQFTKREDGSLDRAVILTEREYLKDAKIRLPQQKKGDHIQNFLDSVIAGVDPIAPVEAGARTAICCHLMNLSYYKQQPIHWDPELLRFSDKSCDPAWMVGARRNWES